MIWGVSIAELLRLMQAHLLLSACAVVAALTIGLPVAIWAAHNRRASAPLLGAISLAQTVPGLALLALFYPLLLLIARATGWAIPALGFLPALLALTIYALLPIVRNGVAAIRGIDPALLEAADGLGMNGGQRLRLVELPLGAPVILAGIRTAAVWTIGTATLATTIGQPSLGDLIFSGLQTEDWQRVLVGCVAAAVLALVVDALLALIEHGLASRSRVKWGTGLALLLLAALASFAGPGGDGGQRTVVVGAKNFSEQYILAGLIEERLHRAGFRTERRDNLGSAIAYRALAAGDIGVYVDYSGTLWANVLQRKDNPPSAEMIAALKTELARRDGVALEGSLGFENAYAFAMKRTRTEALQIKSLDDLSTKASQLKLASDLEFLSRPEWQAVESAYGLRFKDARSYSPTFIYRALGDGSADVISAFSSDGRIAAQDLVTLTDPRHALPSYDAVLLFAPKTDSRVAEALKPLIGRIGIDAMREANWMVDRDKDKRTPAEAAKWLDTKINKSAE